MAKNIFTFLKYLFLYTAGLTVLGYTFNAIIEWDFIVQDWNTFRIGAFLSILIALPFAIITTRKKING